MSDFSILPLHDAVVNSIVFLPAESSATVKGLFFCTPGEDAIQGHLFFSGATHIEISHQAPWGPSSSINTGREGPNNQFIIEMQSGDVIKVVARDWTFSLSDA
jgi:hypothetical protein